MNKFQKSFGCTKRGVCKILDFLSTFEQLQSTKVVTLVRTTKTKEIIFPGDIIVKNDKHHMFIFHAVMMQP